MKWRHFSLLMIFSIISTLLCAQISIKQADRIVQEYVEKEIIEYYWLYTNEKIVADKNGVTTITDWKKEPISVNSSCFVYFIDENPFANWAHPCRYLFVNNANGELYEIKAKTPHENLETWKKITSLPEISEGIKFDFSKNNPNFRSDINIQNCYAVIISGGYDLYNNWERYWNDCSAIYSILIQGYGYLKSNIYVLMSDGTDPAIDRHLINGDYDSSPLDLDGDGLPDIQYAATKNNITMVFNTLADILTPDDHLFIFTTDHGDLTHTGEATLELWYETITASEFALEVDKVNAGYINVVMEQCFSGGFITHLEKLGRTIATACADSEYSYAMPPSYTYNEFVFHWISAVAGFTPFGDSVNADYNNDGYISIKEAFDFAEVNDTQWETPQYSSMASNLGYHITLYGCFIPYDLTNQTITTNTTITSCGDINVQNVIVQSGATLTLKGININMQDLIVQSGATLIVNGTEKIYMGPGFKIESGAQYKASNL